MNDPILDELDEIRRDFAAEHSHDLGSMFDYWRKRQADSGRVVVKSLDSIHRSSREDAASSWVAENDQQLVQDLLEDRLQPLREEIESLRREVRELRSRGVRL